MNVGKIRFEKITKDLFNSDKNLESKRLYQRNLFNSIKEYIKNKKNVININFLQKILLK